ncbi:uncharacterized protein OS9 [Drosophila kikkawai]|uniref:Uncharacterized protein OS9 n=1 Tax=Drosophila kikkawai TaxID=30033 RepID=A0A6P4I9T0_DROKI|nr:uncharacterized protein LOC108072615 [Drosophila kikkawai]
MANRVLWTFLFALTVLQSSWSAPTFKRLQVEFDVANEMFQLMSATLEDFKDFFQSVIDEAELILPPDSKSTILEMCQELINVLNTMDIEDSLEMERMEEAMEDIVNLFESLDSSKLSSEADEIVVSIFEQHGGEDIERRLEEKLADALQRIEQRLADYISTWTDSRQARNSDFLKWFMDFKNEKDPFEKLDLLYQSDFL